MASIVDNTFSRTEATFYYAGRNRLVRRDMFNGTKTYIEYEDSGCGGFTGLVESVRHEGSFGQVLFQEERRYDVNANVTSQRWNHLGEVGNVYRYDATYRMTDEYEGVNLQGSALDTYANPANTPTAFNGHYTFDTRGNRTLVEQTDDSSSTVFDIGYSPDATTNVYDIVGGETFEYDIIPAPRVDTATRKFPTPRSLPSASTAPPPCSEAQIGPPLPTSVSPGTAFCARAIAFLDRRLFWWRSGALPGLYWRIAARLVALIFQGR